MSQRVAALEQEVERLTDGAEMENVSLSSSYLYIGVQTCDILFFVRFSYPPSCRTAETRKAAPGVRAGEGRT